MVAGRENAYREIEEKTARLSAKLGCPHPYLAMESLTKQIKRKPGASPLLFGEFLVSLAAFVSNERLSCTVPAADHEATPQLPPHTNTVTFEPSMTGNGHH